MVSHRPRHHLNRRQDEIVAPTADGISDALTLAATATAASLAFDGSASGSSVTSVPPLVLNSTPVVTISSTPTESASPSPTAAASADVATHDISMGTVIGACVGALAGAILLILIGLWFYKRSAPKSKARGGPISPLSATRNARGDNERTRSRLENWDKLGEGEDTWEGKYQTKEIERSNSVGPMEKLTMFKKSTPSVRTVYTIKSDEPVHFNLDPHPFAQYHPNLAQDMASSDSVPPRQFLGKIDSGVSWGDADTLNDSSFLSLRSARMSGAMSPSLDMAIPTPTATSSVLHRWESAEVIDFEGQTADIIDPANSTDSNNPFLHSTERRKSANNPFFGAQSAHVPSLPKSPPKAVIARGHPINPFGDDDDTTTPIRPTFSSHVAATSVSSVSSNDRAIQSLIAALDVSPAEVQERLRVASMQPSVVSQMSAYTSAEEGYDGDVTDAFPLPPSNNNNGLRASP